MNAESASPQGQRERSYDLNLQKKAGEVIDMAGRALVAAGAGVGVISPLAADKIPQPGLPSIALAFFGFVLIFVGVSSQADADAAKEHPDA